MANASGIIGRVNFDLVGREHSLTLKEEISLYSWPPFWLVWLQLHWLCLINNRFTCSAKSRYPMHDPCPQFIVFNRYSWVVSPYSIIKTPHIPLFNFNLINGHKVWPSVTLQMTRALWGLFFEKWANGGLFLIYFWSFQTSNTLFTTNQCEKMSCLSSSYTVPGFNPTTFRTWVISHNH